MSRFIDTAELLKQLNAIWDEHAKKISAANEILKSMQSTQSEALSSYISMLKKAKKAQDELLDSSRSLSTSTKKQVTDLGILETKFNAVLTSNKALKTSYDKLKTELKETNAELAKLKTNTSATTSVTNAQAQSIGNLTAKSAQLTNQLNSANTSIKRIGSSAAFSFNTVGALMNAFGISTGLYLGGQIVKSIYETTKELQSLNLALKMVSESDAEYIRNKNYVMNVSQRWGLEIKSLTQQYIQFYTASKGLLSEKAIQETFEGIAKAGSIMGLSLEKQSAAFYAIDQMMSKGTVTSEELKKQLGNAMPGAIKAAAMAYMDLHPQIKSIQEAEKELYAAMKQGAIDSATYVPLIVKNFQKLYGIENLNHAETLIAAENRLKNSWTDMIRVMSDSDSSGVAWFFTKTIEGASILLDKLKEIIRTKKEFRDESGRKGENDATGVFEGSLGDPKKKDGSVDYEEKKRRAIVAQVDARKMLLQLQTETLELMRREREMSKHGPSVGLEMLKDASAKGLHNIKYYAKILKDANEYLYGIENPQKPKTDTGTGGAGKAIKDRIVLNFDWIKSEYELKKAILEKDKAAYAHDMDDDSSTLAKRMEARIEYSKKSMELLQLEADEQKAVNLEKYTDDLEKNKVAHNNKRITTEQFNQNILDLNKRFTFENGLVDVKYQQKWQDLLYSNLEFSKKINLKRIEYAERTSKAEVDFYKKNLSEIIGSKSVNDSDYIQAVQDLNRIEIEEATKKRDKALKLAGDEADLKTAIWAEYGNDVQAADDKTNDYLEKNRLRRVKREQEIADILREARGHTTVMGTKEPGYLSGAPTEMQQKFDELLRNYQIAVESGDEAAIADRKMQLDEFKQYITDINEYASGFFNDFVESSGFKTFFDVIGGKIKGFGDNWKVTFLAISEMAQEAINFMEQGQSEYFDRQRERLEDQYKTEIALAGDNEAAKADIDRQYEERKRQIANREAKAQQKMAMFNIAINTAQAIMGLWVKPGFPDAIPLAIAVGALGALQLAMVASKAPPQYFTGTDNADEGFAWTDERGAELHTDKNNVIKSFGSDRGPRLKYLEKGDKIIPAHKTSNITNYDDFSGQLDDILLKNNILYYNENNNQLDATGIIDSIYSLQHTIQNKETSEEHYDERGWRKYQKKNGQKIEDKSNRIRFKKSIL